jgi:hypothetical protein
MARFWPVPASTLQLISRGGKVPARWKRRLLRGGMKIRELTEEELLLGLVCRHPVEDSRTEAAKLVQVIQQIHISRQLASETSR